MAIMGMTTPLIGMKCMDAVAAHCTWADGSIVDFSKFPGGIIALSFPLDRQQNGRKFQVRPFSHTEIVSISHLLTLTGKESVD